MLVDAREGWRLGFGGRVNDFWMRISKGAVCTRGDELSGEKYVSPPVMICLAGVIAVGHGWDGTRRQFPYFEHREAVAAAVWWTLRRFLDADSQGVLCDTYRLYQQYGPQALGAACYSSPAVGRGWGRWSHATCLGGRPLRLASWEWGSRLRPSVAVSDIYFARAWHLSTLSVL